MGIAGDDLVVVLYAQGVLADVVFAQLAHRFADDAVVSPQAGLAVANQAFVGIDAHKEEGLCQDGFYGDDFHPFFSVFFLGTAVFIRNDL